MGFTQEEDHGIEPFFYRTGGPKDGGIIRRAMADMVSVWWGAGREEHLGEGGVEEEQERGTGGPAGTAAAAGGGGGDQQPHPTHRPACRKTAG